MLSMAVVGRTHLRSHSHRVARHGELGRSNWSRVQRSLTRLWYRDWPTVRETRMRGRSRIWESICSRKCTGQPCMTECGGATWRQAFWATGRCPLNKDVETTSWRDGW